MLKQHATALPEMKRRVCEVSDLVAASANTDASYLERLQREAYNRLNSFPRKVIELNALMESHMPDSVKNYCSNDINQIELTMRRAPKSRSASFSSTHPNSDITVSTSELNERFIDSQVDVSSSATRSYRGVISTERGRTRNGICKRRYFRVRGLKGLMIRRQPGPLGQILAVIARKIAIATRAMLAPSWYIIHRIISIFFQRKELKNAQCGGSLDLSCSLGPSYYCVSTFTEDNSPFGRLISMMRPAAVQLITDTTTLKRWLQSVALRTKPPSPELVNATRTIETIDCWAYELFFHVKCLQVNHARSTEKSTDSEKNGESKVDDEVSRINLWHRFVQLRDNYIILYETLYDDPKIHEVMPPGSGNPSAPL